MTGPILTDTSVWVDYLNGIIDIRTNFLNESISKGSSVLICPVILQEILQGIRKNSDYRRVKDILLSYPILEMDPVQAAIEAADLYRDLRKKGLTVRKSNDCLIASYAIKYKIPLLHNDSDFDLIASRSRLEIAKP